LLCCSDTLGIPAILRLKQQNVLAAIAIADKIAVQLIPLLQSVGIARDEIHILSKKNLANELKELIDVFKPDALFTLTFPWLVPDAILALLPNRCINFHFGILPKYKGADPIFWQLKNGEQTGGISIHIMTPEIDKGPVLQIEELPIFAGETYGLYSERLGGLAADAVVKVLNNVDDYKVNDPLTDDKPPLFFKAPNQTDCTINWHAQTAAEIEQLVNATNPRYNGAATSIRQNQVYLLEVSPADVNNAQDEQYPPGTIIHADLLYGLIVACIDKQFLKINVARLQQGYFSGGKLFSLGFKVGEVFF